MDLNEYSLDTSDQHPMAQHQHQHPQQHSHQGHHPSVPFAIDTFMENDPIITSAGPFHQNFSFSPSTSPMIPHGPFANLYNGSSVPSSSLNAADFYSPPGSAYQSAVSTPHPHPDKDSFYFGSNDMRQQSSQGFRQPPPNMGNPMGQHFMYNGVGNANSANHAIFQTSTTGQDTMATYSTAPSSFGHIDPTQVFQADHPGTSPGVSMQQENMFSFGETRMTKRTTPLLIGT